MTLLELIEEIVTGKWDDDLERLDEAIRARRKEERRKQAEINRLTLLPGARVRLKNLSPKYLNGLEGEVVEQQHGRKKGLRVKFVEPEDIFMRSQHRQAAQRFGSSVRVPASCVEPVT